MSWEAIGAVGEVLGALAVFITLLYLAAQIRQNNKMARFETTREIMAQFNACNQLYATDASIRFVLLKTEPLTPEESDQLYSYVDMYCNALGTTQLAYQEGLVDEALYNNATKDVEVALQRWPNFRAPAERWLRNYPEAAGSTIFSAIACSADTRASASS